MHRRLGPLKFDLIHLSHEILQIRHQVVDLLLDLPIHDLEYHYCSFLIGVK